ncbi:MAG TPA: hypothetical protein VGN95_02375 [Pyrinomonadaceae bacterium]|jgi:hypothetical protein|nr:hypothetical protein [Pyrinomonadaceae bacterium]
MPSQDRTGSKYEQLLAASLNKLGYVLNGTTGKNYLHPSKRSRLIFPGTYIQPDLIVRDGTKIKAVLYATHWSNTRSSKYKFWRTWEEAAQQKLAVSMDILTINCVFEALLENSLPGLYTTSDDLPRDANREGRLPIQLNGWDPGIGWALVESFDSSLLFPVGYTPVYQVVNSALGEHDAGTTKLIEKALATSPKAYLYSQWKKLSQIRNNAQDAITTLTTTHSRYRIGLLHVYLLYRFFGEAIGERTPDLGEFIKALAETDQESVLVNHLIKTKAFHSFDPVTIYNLFERLSRVPVRVGANPQTICTTSTFSSRDASTAIRRIRFNDDLRLCLQDLKEHISADEFIETIQRTFIRFDQAYGVKEAIQDLADPALVEAKEEFVRKIFSKALKKENALYTLLQAHANSYSSERTTVSSDQQNWVFEMLLYLTQLNSAEDIQTRFKDFFEQSGHKLRPHAPYGGHAQTVAFLLQGRDVCEQWSTTTGRRTLSEDQFRSLCWQTVAKCIVQAHNDRNEQASGTERVISKYLENKSMRIISSDLNGFYIMVDHYLSDICKFKFTSEGEEEGNTVGRERICASWQTDVINGLWGGRPLETWMEGVSRNGRWLIKVQSSQDGNEGHKTKELSGRCRGIHLAWSHGSDVRKRSEWSFTKRPMMKLALVLDGDWDTSKKQNLYEAGWDWVGDVSELSELRKLIKAGT